MAATGPARSPNTPSDKLGENEESDNQQSAEELEAALAQLGHFGCYQKYVVFMLCIPNLFAAMYSLNYVFVADQVPFRFAKRAPGVRVLLSRLSLGLSWFISRPPYGFTIGLYVPSEARNHLIYRTIRCVVPECEGTNDLDYHNETVQYLLPDTSCQRYTPLIEQSSCLREDFHETNMIPCDNFVYENFSTIFVEFGLACREWLRTLVGTVRNSALPFALLLTGYISDVWGRRTAFCIFSACAGIMGIIKAFSVNYTMYLVMEFFEAALGYGFTSAAYVMVIELARPSLRASFACATGIAYGVGGVLFALIAWRVPYWRHLLWTIHSPALLLPLYWILLDESPRWLHAKGKKDKTEAVIRKAARWNKILVDEEVMKGLHKEHVNIQTKQSNPWLKLLRSKVLMGRFAICCWCWIATTFVYYGLTINSVSLSGDKYVNFALNMSMEIVASFLIMMMLERFGRKKSIFVAFLLCGVACVVPNIISHKGTGLGMYFVGKLAISFAFNSVYVFTAELFPTSTRSSALAACSLVGRLGSILAPQTPHLSLELQTILYGFCSLAAALVVLLVPETRQTRLPFDVEDAEVIRRDTLIDLDIPAPAPARPVVLSADT